jgi:hypothetical protein
LPPAGDMAWPILGDTEATRSAQWLMEPKREPCLDGNVGVDRLTPPLACRRRVPGRYRFLSEKNGEAASSHHRGIAFRPVCHSVSGLRDLMAATLTNPW